ncbi:hypothetical protein COU17_01950 [Candidatus Kaiserbacteria bacterium CG10_big_fil_rev_8_21_14_0_10_49_17]|uniref:Uncharacterized protein n=1 Tax=Candidatus Kaiserbacteria bacterium CG10_big_fil_rev_8_21_14_0_10_49_17 TaxID=1974609 RepID=A0A2M6WEE8_9BACT|nr:MAG: hypothetical protein COU17_01950 [Candidatus Kaiserbacteria bacterium CG10_big_fil_rev_8_21_14_0_10_49_17]
MDESSHTHETKYRQYFNWNTIVQVGLVGFTTLGFLLTALKLPEYGLLVALISEVFWLYSSYRAWKEANQIGIFITTIVITLILIMGVVNYWFL